jgi:uncharacterized protein (TIGR02270 family)
MTIISSVVERHAEEAGMLWLIRDQAVTAPHYTLSHLRTLDNRVEAHLDGLRIAGDAGWAIIEQQLEANLGPGEVFVAAFHAFESGKAERIQKVLDLAAPVAALRRGVISALGWLAPAAVEQHLQPLLQAKDANLLHLGVGGANAHRLNPGTALERALGSPDLSLRARGLRAVGIMGYPAWAMVLRKELRSPDLACRFAAAWSLGRLTTESAALGELQTIALVESHYRLAAVNLLLRRLDSGAAHRVLRTLAQAPGADRVSVFAAGVLGDPAEVPRLLAAMAKPELARPAGEAFSWITGIDLALHDLDGNAPEGFEAGPNEDPLDDRVDLDPDGALPWPDVAKIQGWWTRHRGQFREGVRHLRGQPITPDVLKATLQDGNQRQRAAAALELCLAEPTRPIFEIRSPGFRQ